MVNFQTIAISKYFSKINVEEFIVYYNNGDIAQIVHTNIAILSKGAWEQDDKLNRNTQNTNICT